MNNTEGREGVLWQCIFLSRTFFGACRAHNANNNRQNHYCIDCQNAACRHCLQEGSHADHRVIKLYRLVYRDVVCLDDMNRHMDCSRIQPYASNGRLVIALSPLPHQGSGRLNPHIACQFCARRLIESYRFCSIACKLGIDTGKSTTKENPVQPAPDNCRDPSDNAGGNADNDNDSDASGCARRSKLGRSRRKGIPMRAPFN